MKQLLFALLSLIFLSGPAAPQELVRIAAVVNDNVISMLDLLARIKMAGLATGLEDSPELRQQLVQPVLRNLIEEQLQIQEAERQGIVVSDEEIISGFGMVEQQNGLRPGQLDGWLASLGIPRIFFERQIRAQILWAKFVASRLRPQVFVSEEDVEEELAGLEINRGKPEYLVSQIDLYFGEPSKAEEVTATAHQLVRQVRAGAQFAAIAAQFSHNAIGGSGGDMGWMRESQLRPELALVVAGMEVGDVSDPVRTIDGVHIIHLRQRREIMASDPSRVRVRLIQVTLPNLTGGADDAVARQSVFVEEIRDNIRGCEDMASLVEELKSDASGDLGWVSLGDLPDVFRGPLLNLEIGVPSAPVRTEFGVHLLMVCERDDPEQNLDRRGTIRARMEATRLEVLARRLLRDLRRSAFVDLRV
ncbi:MAG TPA: hypothetical protein EYN52_06910 [Alphaproteobacteria bacterium]|nr:hypothetical protein [Alphaproteobacteria bacterium]